MTGELRPNRIRVSVPIGRRVGPKHMYSSDNLLVRPAYEDLNRQTRERGWTDEHGRITVGDLMHTAGTFQDESGMYHFFIEAYRTGKDN